MADSEEFQHGPRAQAGLGLGERLRSARKARALSVTQVAEALHLEEPMVLALEEDRFEAMGAPVFVRGHLRRYAQLVGLAPDAVLEAYRAAVPESVAPPPLARARVEPESVRVGPWLFWLIGGVLVAVLAFTLFGGGEEPAATQDAPALLEHDAMEPAGPLPESAPEPMPVPGAEAPAAAAGPAAPADASAAAPPGGGP
ncbi:Cytoskeleton protein RodZ [Gammaproteobacteria bacterium]|nr:Cytoskeleton protein RodZ [Gammaproteobacteria bacterium]